MNQFGVITYSLDVSQQGLIITHNLNQITSKYYDISPIVFYREYYPVIAKSLETAQRLLSSPAPIKKFFYVNNLEWLYSRNNNYDELSEIYANDNIELIARSEYHFDLLQKSWKKPVAIIEDFNYIKVLELLHYLKN